MTARHKILNDPPVKPLPEFGYRPEPRSTQHYGFALFLFWGVVFLL